jgi:phosphatidylserine/phosphatidylglycerophosphate/cardiolipin synthase-like enzyme
MLRFFLILLLFFSLGVGLSNSNLFFSPDFKSVDYQNIQIEPLLSKKLNSPVNFDVFFNIGGKSFSASLYKDLVLAQKSVEIFVYSFNDPNLFFTLDQLAQKGVAVTIHTDFVKQTFLGPVLQKMNTGIDVKYLNKQFSTLEEAAYSMHHKTVIIDNKIAYWGSNNLTWFQEDFDPGFMLRTTNKNFLDVLNKDLDIIRQGVSGYKKLALKNYNPFIAKFDNNQEFYEFWRSPGYKKFSMRDRLVELIDNSNTSIKLMAWYLTDRDVVSSLLNAARRGVQITMLLDDFAASRKDSAIQLNKGVFRKFNNVDIIFDSKNQELVDFDQVRDPNFNSFLHFHTLIIDSEILFTSSNNFSRRGFFFNDELALITNQNRLVTDFSKYFDFMKKKLH